MDAPRDKISRPVLHTFEFRDGLICRENVWIDGRGAQLTGGAVAEDEP